MTDFVRPQLKADVVPALRGGDSLMHGLRRLHLGIEQSRH